MYGKCCNRYLQKTRQGTGEGNGTPLQHSCLGNPMDGGAWWAAVHGVAKSRTWLGNFPFTFHFHALEKEIATHSSVLAWRIPGTGEPGWLPSMGSHRVGNNWSDLAAAYTTLTNLNSVLKRTDITLLRHHFADKGLYNQSYVLPSSHVWTWELDP